MSILDWNQSYTFSKYFEMGISAQDLAEEFSYKFSRKRLNLSQYQGELLVLNHFYPLPFNLLILFCY